VNTDKACKPGAAAFCSFEYGRYSHYISIVPDRFIEMQKNSEYITNGLVCRSALECLCIVFQHEMVHLINHRFCDKKLWGPGGHGALFKKTALNIFGQTDIYHGFKSGVHKSKVYVYTEKELKEKVSSIIGIGEKITIIYKDGKEGKYELSKFNPKSIKFISVNNPNYFYNIRGMYFLENYDTKTKKLSL
jgi:hypothetical protein